MMSSSHASMCSRMKKKHMLTTNPATGCKVRAGRWEVGGEPLESSACFSDSGIVHASGSISFKCNMGKFPSYSRRRTGTYSSLDLWQS